MDVVSLGKVVVVTAGIPVALSGVRLMVHTIVVSQIPATTGITYFGKVGLVKATGAGVLKAFVPPGASGFIDEHDLPTRDGDGNCINLADYAVDANVNSEGLQVYYTIV